jgi:uncharacterized protein (TIGR01777 family)
VTGASGLVGRALCEALVLEGAAFRVLSRDPQRAERVVPGAESYHLWQPFERGNVGTDLVEEARAMVHLASPLVVPGRWNEAHRQELYDSCVMGTRGVVAALAEARSRPEVLVCASSVAYYGSDPTGERLSSEDAPAGDDFLSRLMADWEAEAARAEQHGVRVVLLRSALILGPDGPLRRLRRAASLGLGGPPGTGHQRQPWIHVGDEVGLLLLALGDSRVSGPLNGVSPHSVTASEFMETLCTQLGVPAGIRPPEWLLRSRFGPGAIAITQGRGAVPARALELGYEFQLPDLDSALWLALGRSAGGGDGEETLAEPSSGG